MTDLRIEYESPRRGWRQDTEITTARIYEGSSMLAVVGRRRKTKRSKWEMWIYLSGRTGSMPLSSVRGEVDAVLTLAENMTWPEVALASPQTERK